mmetsp:Transcript_9776/g.19863  ORF Transcript_9776/g.19863 Transcript_9776/m.19863 type:complete len:306 (+) Transcript_9776:137-1054(+)
MVRVKLKTARGTEGRGVIISLFLSFGCLLAFLAWLSWDAEEHSVNRIPLPNGNAPKPMSLLLEEDRAAVSDKKAGAVVDYASSCPYRSLTQLTTEERFPGAGPRHQVDPPQGGKVTLVCCETTKGPWSIMVHENWAPLGSQRFLSMVRSEYFSNRVPLMRCLKNFLCQFGLAGAASKQFDARIQDDPNWLPEGPDYKVNAAGVKRFARGYFAYAGAGKNSRGVQLIVSLQANPRLGGGSPWEVPWGELVGEHSFATLSKIYTGYGDHGPSQGRLRKEGASPEVAKEFTLLDYVLSCQVVDEAVDS